MFYYYFHCTVTKSVEDAPFYLVSRGKKTLDSGKEHCAIFYTY